MFVFNGVLPIAGKYEFEKVKLLLTELGHI